MSGRRRARRPVMRARRNLIVFALSLAVIAGLITVVGMMNRAPLPIMSPETAEIAEKRESPENLFYVLPRIWEENSIPERPEPLFVPSQFNAKVMEPYNPPAGSLGILVHVQRVDDDPLLGEFIVGRRPIVEATRAALVKGYFLWPEDWGDRANDVRRGRLGDTFNLLIASMAYTARPRGLSGNA